MKIAAITAGAAGMFCGSCMHDNTLAAALIRLGHECLLIPTYTPITTDEPDVSHRRVFFGGINVYLQEKLALFRHTPWFVDRLLNLRGLLRWAGRFAVRTRYETLGGLTISMLQGTDGHQSKEVEKLVTWLEHDVRPEVLTLTNVLLSGLVPELKRRLDVPILAWLQGDDIFLDALPSPDRRRCIALIAENCRHLDGFLVTCAAYADFMADYLGLPRDRMHVIYPGLNLAGFGEPITVQAEPPFTIGFLARIGREKGLPLAVEAYRLLMQDPAMPRCRLRLSGWLGSRDQRALLDECLEQLRQAGLGDDVEYVASPTHADKVRFLKSLDVLTVPTLYREPKGLPVLEALACGVPVVQPRHGSFPELIERTGGGVLFNPGDAADLAVTLRRVLQDVALRRQLSQQGWQAIRQHFSAEGMARQTAEVLSRAVERKKVS